MIFLVCIEVIDMKRKILLSISFLICISLLSCTNKNATGNVSSLTSQSSSVQSSLYNYPSGIGRLYKLDTEYENALKDSDGSILSFTNITTEYGDKWKTKVTEYYNTLYKALDSDGKKVLEQSQNDWQKSSVSNNNFNNYFMNHYEATGGTKAAASYLNLYRDRAVVLLSKCQQLGLELDE